MRFSPQLVIVRSLMEHARMLTASNMVDFTLILAAHQILSKTARIGAEAKPFQQKALLALSIQTMSLRHIVPADFLKALLFLLPLKG